MSKEIVTEADLRNMIQEKISKSEELNGDCREVIVNTVYWHELDETGSNWDVHSMRNAAGCEGVVNVIIAEFKEKYNVLEK